MNKKPTNLRWLISLMLIAFCGFGFAQLSEPPRGSFAGEEFTSELFINNKDAITASLNEGFEGSTFPPEGWKVINNGDPNSWIRSTLNPRTGSACASITTDYLISHDDWLITPRLQPVSGNSTLSFWAKNSDEFNYYLEEFNVRVSTTGNNKEDFTFAIASNVEPPNTYTKYSYDLSAHIGQVIYVAVQAISLNMDSLYLDDFEGPNIFSGTLPAPGVVTNIAPANGATNINNGSLLKWSFGEYTAQYQVMLGTTNPPTDVVIDFTSNLATSYMLNDMQLGTTYYWQVNAKNTSGTTAGSVWSFTTPASAQTYDEGFEGTTFPPAGWKVINGGGSGTWERSTNDPRTGEACARIYSNTVAHNDWLITPALMPEAGNSTFALWARNANTYSREKFNVKLSTTGNDEPDFTVILAMDVDPAPYSYTQYPYDLSAYIGQTIYIGIQITTTNQSNLCIDDVTGPPSATPSALPEAVTNIAPANGAVNIENGELLSWEFGANTNEYEVVLGTTNPPTTVVVPFTGNLATSYELTDLQTYTQYYWRVNARNAEGTTAGPVWSFTTAHDELYTSVNVTVTLNSGGSPMGTKVKFTNTSEPSLGLVYEETLGLSGQFTWNEFLKGTYDIEVSKGGYSSIDITDEEIVIPTSFTWELTELLSAPTGLSVTPTGLATWTAGATIQFEPFVESFDGLANGELPDGWIKSPVTDNWGANNANEAGGTAPEMRFNFLPYNSGTFYLKTPIITTIGQSSLQLSFKNYLNDYQSGYTIKVISIADGEEHIIQEWVSPASMPPATLTYELTAAHGVGATDFQIAWVFMGNSTRVNRWCIDDVMLTSAAKNSRAFEAYNVYLEGALVANVTNTHYQYGANGETLVHGQTYLAEVSAAYTSGESDKVSYSWVYKSCESYPTPENFTATQVEGTVDVALSWTVPAIPAGDDQIDFARITRNGEVIAETEDASYLDLNLSIETYVYCITFVYESGAETCPATICETVEVTNTGFINGNVKQAAYMGGANLEGAVVMLTDVANPAVKYILTTNALGNYSAEVLDGTYNYEVSAVGYATQNLENVVVAQTATVTHDFVLLEYPFPAVNIVAAELNDDAVQINWDINNSAISEWLYYDDGINTDGIGGPETFTWAIKFDPDQLVDYAGTSLTKISIFNHTSDVNTLRICEGPDAQTQIYEQSLTGLPIEDWAEVSLNNPVPIDVTKEFWITVYTTAGAAYPAAVGAGQNQPNGDLMTIDGVTWEHLADIPLPYTWNLRGFVTNMRTNRTVELTRAKNRSVYEPSSVNRPFETRGIKNTSANAAINTNAVSRELQGFSVYRTTCVTGELQLLGYTTEQTFTDETWGAAEPEVYKWGVVAEYNENVATIRFSNCLDNNMLTQVSVTVTTNSGDSPVGTNVSFINKSEPGLVYEVEIDESGYFMWDEFRKGTYDIHVEKRGFESVEVSDYGIDGPKDFVWMLQELIFPVADLQVSPTARAEWRDGAPVPFEPFIEDFSNGIDRWTRYPETDNWQWSETNLAGGEAPEVRFYWSPNSLDKFYFISPVMNTFGQSELEMSFTHAINEVMYGDSYSIRLITIIDGVERLVIEFDDNNLPPTEVVTMLTAEHGVGAKDFQIAFVYEGNAYYMNWWNIDDIMINTPQNRDREFLTYNVFLDGEFVADTPEPFYQYDPSTLVQGQEYFTEVTALYTTWLSEAMSYTWTYQPCDSFPGPTQLDYEIVNLNDVVLNWSGNAPAIGDFYEGFEAGTLPTGWEIYDVDNDGYNWENTKIQFPDFEPHSGLYCMASASYVNEYGPVTPNNWLVTPAIDVTSASKLKFWVGAQDPMNPREWYNVKISTTGNAPEDFNITLREAWSRLYWAEVIIDLSAYAGQTVYIAFQHMTPPELEMYYIKIDDVTVTNTYTRAAYTAPLASGISHSIPFKTQNMTQNEIDARLLAQDNAGSENPGQNTPDAGNRFDTGELLGTNIYRDGVLIAEKVFGQTFTDKDLAPGTYEYCINYVYTDNAMPCMPLCVSDVLVTGEDCIAPYDLTAEANQSTGEVSLAWTHDAFTGTYLSYGNGVYADAIGLSDFSPITVAIQFDPDILEAYDGKVFSKINFFYGFGNIADVTVQVWEGTTLILEEPVTSTIVGQAWNEIEFDTPVLIDGTKSYKIGYTVANYDSHPIGVQYYSGIPNSDLIYMNGGWNHMSNILSFAWLLEAYVSNANAATVDYTSLTSKVINTSDSGVPVSAPYVNLNRGTEGKANRALMGFNIYRDGTLLEALWPETTYSYQEDQSGMICYTVTAVYEYCGETDPSNEACVVLVGINNQELSNITIYPNPANSELNIKATGNIRKVELLNSVGQIVMSQSFDANQIRLDVSQYKAGLYIVAITQSIGDVITRRVTIY
ncbi:MAG TPA: choice-of-anchor J domain-containing protein [Bacteroidales bacterium]|nr:choice-of-anchor J domain-containing protein [Bacteroidales bacterium]